MGIVSLGISLTVGTALGAMGAYCGGRLDNLIGRLMDMLLAFPPLLLAIAIISLAGPGLTNAMIAVGVVQIPVFARLIRGQILILKEQEFVIAARATGATDLNMLVVHLLPNCLSPLIVQSTFVFATAILSAAMLGFLGLGAQPPSPEWGAMLSKARGYLRVAPALSILPGLAIMMSVLSLNLLGDALRDALDPKLGAVRRQV
ncbi:MAG: ABC transporter permease [bacterium]|nr:ABC transporter permease [bacterium]